MFFKKGRAQQPFTGSRTARSSIADDATIVQQAPAAHKEKGGALAETVEKPKVRDDGKVELLEKDCYDELGFTFPTWKKWWILSVIFVLQCSMNFNAGAYGSAVTQLEEEFGISAQKARVGQGLFLICYAFGCELWAPFSEEYGRWPILQLSLFLVNVWQIPCALAPNYATIVAFRILGGFSSAGGSVTLGIVADLYESEVQGHAVAFIVLSSVGGSVLGPIIGAFQARFLSWRWNFWLQLIFGGATQLLQFFTPETKASVLMTRIAKKRRAAGQTNVYSTDELRQSSILNAKHFFTIVSRPFYMFVTEPIVLCLSLLSGFSDALIFTFLEAYGPVFKQWDFGVIGQGLAFCAIGVGYFLAYFSFWPFINRNEKKLAEDPTSLPPESRLYWLLYTAPLLSIGLFGFAWTSIGPQYGIPWIAPLLFTALVGIANYAIYMATIDYMINAYGPYSASATGGNGFARDFLAGIAAFYATPLYTNLGTTFHLAWASTLLGCLAICVTIPIYVFYWYGPQIRARSKFALSLAADKQVSKGRMSPSEKKPQSNVPV